MSSLALYHPNWHDQVFAVESAEVVSHTENGAGAALQGASVDHAEDTGEALVRRGCLFDLQRTELAVAFKENVDLLGVAVAVEVEERLASGVLVAFHDLRNGVVFEQCAAHGAALGNLRRRPARQVADEAGVVKIQLRRFDGTLQHVVGIGMQ